MTEFNATPVAESFVGGGEEDRFIFASETANSGDMIDGAGGHDRLVVLPGGVVDFSGLNDAFTAIEELVLQSSSTKRAFALFDASQFGAAHGQLPLDLLLTGGDGISTVAVIAHLNAAVIELSDWTFSFWGSDDLVQVTGSGDADSIIGSTQADLIEGNLGADDIQGGGGDDSAYGGDGNDRIDGGDGNDVLVGGSGVDHLAGGDGIDIVDYRQETGGGPVTVNLADGTATDTFGHSDTLLGIEGLKTGNGDDTITVGVGNNSIDAGGGLSDRIMLAGRWIDYTIDFVDGGFRFVDRRASSPDGVDTVVNVELFKFAYATDPSASFVEAAAILNDAPTDIAISATMIAEGSASGTLVGTLTSTDADALLGDTATYSLIDNAGGRFAISGANLVVADGALLDFESAPAHAIIVRVTDASGAFHDKTLVIGLANINSTPISDVDGSPGGNVVEGAPAGTTVGITALAKDVSGPALTYSLADSAGGRFAIDSVTGVVSVADGSLIDYETTAAHSVTVLASDGFVGMLSFAFAIEVVNVSGATITGTKGSDTIDATKGMAGLVATAEEDTIDGAGGNDKLSGAGGDDRLIGGAGKDRLTGGDGSDTFVFDARPKKGKFDTLTDCTSDDRLVIDHEAFKGLTEGTLDQESFRLGKAARDADDRIIYNAGKGTLSYDADRKGGDPAIQFAKFAKGLALTAEDFLVI